MLYGIVWATIYFFSSLPLKEYLVALWGVRFLLLIVVIFQLFFTPGRILLNLEWLRITREGLSNAIVLSGRLTLAILFSISLSLTTSPLEISAALESILKKLRVPNCKASEFGITVTLALTFIPLISLQVEKVTMAQKARGVVFDRGNLFKRIKNALTVIIPVIANVLKRAQDTAMALQVRNYRPNVSRSSYKAYRWGWSESSILIFTIAATLIMIFIL